MFFKMYFYAVAVAVASATLASAATIQVLVGDTGLAFTPPSVTAASGDIINFQFRSKNHSVTQSTFASPCLLVTTPTVGTDSGFQPVTTGAAELPSFNVSVSDPSVPLWFFCAQTIPLNHCQSGMVFAVNAPPDKSFEAFQANAKASSPNSAPPASSASSASEVPSGIYGTTVPTTSVTPSGIVTSTSTVDASAPTGASTTTTSDPSSTAAGNSALQLDGSASTLLAFASLFAGLML